MSTDTILLTYINDLVYVPFKYHGELSQQRATFFKIVLEKFYSTFDIKTTYYDDNSCFRNFFSITYTKKKCNIT